MFLLSSFLQAFFLLALFYILMVTFLIYRPTSSTGGRGSRGMTTINKGNKALKVISMYHTDLNVSYCEEANVKC